MIAFVVASLAGFFLLAKAADHMVVGAARLSSALRISPVVIGAVVIGFGTSAPELVVSALAAAQDSLDIAVGNVAGSNIANLTLVMGVAAMITPLAISSTTLRREAPLSAGSVVIFALALAGGLERWEGALLLVLLVLFLANVLRHGRQQPDAELVSEVEEYLDDDREISLRSEALRTVAGLAGTVVGAQLLVWGATGVADEVGLAEGFIGLTLVALGTSLPELLTAVQAARRAEDELIVGNLLGSNIFNSLAVAGTAALVGPGALADPDLARTAALIMVAVACLAWFFLRTGHAVVRGEGVLLLGLYVAAVPLLAA